MAAPFTNLPPDEEGAEELPNVLRGALGLPPTREEDVAFEPPSEEIELTEDEEDEQRAAENMDLDEVLQMCLNYLNTARDARESGRSDRETNWRQNQDGYWTFQDNSEKEEWQATESIPEIQNSVDRLTASLRSALVQGGQWYTITDPGDPDGRLQSAIRRFMDVLLDRCGRDTTEGHVLGFEHVFGDIVKSGALMMAVAQVSVDENGSPTVEALDARECYLDPTMRNLYFVRQYETDWHTLHAEAEAAPKEAGWHMEAVKALRTSGGEDSEGREDKGRSSGMDIVVSNDGNRRPVMLHEYRCDMIDVDGHLVARNQMIVMGDERSIIRGPIRNPFWHQRDWRVAAPLIQIPFSVYGRSWVEGFRSLVDTYTSMTNLILDASFIEAMKAFMVWPDALEDPTQADSIHAGKTYLASDQVAVGTPFIQTVDTGRLSPTAFTTWQAVKQEIREATSQNELSLGQLPPKGDITATEIVGAQQGQSQLVRSMARDLEQRVLEPILDLLWSVGLQFLDAEDPRMRQDLGDDVFDMMVAQKADFRERRIRFKAKGISATLEKADKVRAKLSIIQTVADNQFLLQLFQQKYSMERLVGSILADMGVDLTELELTEDERARAEVANQQAAAQNAAGAGPSGGGAPSLGGSQQGGP